MRMIDGEELYQIESLLKTDIVERSKTANWLMGQVLHDIEASPTIDPEGLPVVQMYKGFAKAMLDENKKLNVDLDRVRQSKGKLERELEKVKAERDVLFKLLQSAGIAERLEKALDMTENGLFGGPATMG